MSTNQDGLEDLLFGCIVAVGVREEGAVTDLDTLIIDRQKTVDELETFIARSNIALLAEILATPKINHDNSEEFKAGVKAISDIIETKLRANTPEEK